MNVLYYFYGQNENDQTGLSSFLKAGLAKIDIDASIPFEIANSTQVAIGLGVEYAWDNGFAVRGDLESFDEDAALLTVGLLYRFGKQKTEHQTVVAEKVEPEEIKVMDSDGDGVSDDLDQCPQTEPGMTVDNQGCELDSDNDGVVNRKDQCPATAVGLPVDNQGCELDSDNDGVVDSNDQCPASPADIGVDEKGCSLDKDGDGILNAQDECPNTVKGANVNVVGCAIFEAKIEGINFELGSAELTADSKVLLDEAAEALLQFITVRVEIQAHTDSQGKEAINQMLSEDRAKSVVDYLESKGVAADRMQARGFGEAEPLESNETSEGRARNRRVEFRVLDVN